MSARHRPWGTRRRLLGHLVAASRAASRLARKGSPHASRLHHGIHGRAGPRRGAKPSSRKATRWSCMRARRNAPLRLRISRRGPRAWSSAISPAPRRRAASRTRSTRSGAWTPSFTTPASIREPNRGATPEGHAKVLAVNVLAPYMLTRSHRTPRPAGLPEQQHASRRRRSARRHRLVQSTWDTNRAYSESKLYVTALAFAVARQWPKVLSNAVDPGWVPTKMGGRGAPDDLEQGHLTQTWLATSEDAAAKTSGGLWYHRERQQPAAPVAGRALPGRAHREAGGAHRRQTVLSADVDIVIVGGGAAGVGAARRLAGSGLSTLLLEATSRLGGRACTQEIRGLDLDLGAGWLHSADRNSWAAIARSAAIPLDQSRAAWGAQYRNLGFPATEQAAAWQAFESWTQRLAAAPPARRLRRRRAGSRQANGTRTSAPS